MASRLLTVSALATGLLATPVLSQSSGSFDFLTFNVAGLPAFLSDNGVPGEKDVNAGYIGTHLAEGGYDVVHLQEDFNYHAYIYETDNHSYRTPTSGGVPFGSGLNTVANYDWTGFYRETWDKCSIVEADCLTPKGFTYMRMTIQGVEIDFYNLHADAGDTDWDADARSSGVDQVLAAVAANSAGRPVILGGDFNDRWTNDDRSVDRYLEHGFEDAWVVLIHGGEYPAAGSGSNGCSNPAQSSTCEVVDKVLYRSGSDVTLTPTSFAYASDVFVQPNGDIVSDHNPILIEFSWSS